MEETLQFIIMVETPRDRESLLRFLIGAFDAVARRKSNSLDLRGNWIEIWENHDANSELASDPDTGYLHFRWRVESTPMNKDLTETDQVQLAKEIVACLEAHGCACVVCANFENLL